MNSLDLSKLDEIVNLVKSGGNDYWNKEKQADVFRQLNEGLCKLFNLPIIEIELIKLDETFGRLDVEQNKIYLERYSLITFLHEFFHRIFSEKDVFDEFSARIISSLIYAKSFPEKVSKLVLYRGAFLTQKTYRKVVKDEK